MKKSKKDFAKELSTLSMQLYNIGCEMSKKAKPDTNYKDLANSINCLVYTLDNYINILDR